MAIHPTAFVDPKSKIADSAEVGPYCVIGAGVEVGEVHEFPACSILSEQWFSEGQKSDDDEAANVYHAKLEYPDRTLQPGDEIVVTDLDHDANVSPWLVVARDHDLTIKRAPVKTAATAI